MLKKILFKIATYSPIIEKVLKVLSVVISLAAISAIIWEHGTYIESDQSNWIRLIVTTAYVFYILKFFIRWTYSGSKPLKYLKENILDIVVIVFFLLALILSPQIKHLMRAPDEVFVHYRRLFFHIYYAIIFLVEIAKGSAILKKINLSPPLMMMMSFFVLISIGTCLLMLPKMTTNGITFIDALFTATSASCVTGLTVVNTATAFTTSGHIVLMLLMQFGGMSFFISFLSHSFTGLRYQYMVKDILSTNRLSDSFSFLREIIVVTFAIEGVGAILLYMYWQTTGLFDTQGETILFAVFHAISAFNNAGFSLWPDNLMDSSIMVSHFPLMIIMILVFVGGIGYVVIRDFFDPNVIRERKRKRWKKLTDGTQIALITSFVIIAVTAVLFYVFEYNNTLSETSGFNRIFAVIFQSVVARTAGFNIVDVNHLAIPTLLVFIIAMFIGASPGSTGGGIKTTTFFVIIKSLFATIRGKKRIEFNKKTIPFNLVDKAYSIFAMSLIIIMISTIIIAAIEPMIPFKNIVFETTSAFTTCGLSTGILDQFSIAGKAVLTFNMYIGRIGTLTFAYALSKRVKESRHEYPETYFMVG